MLGAAPQRRGMKLFLSGILLCLLFVSLPVDARPRPKSVAKRQTADAPCAGIFNSDFEYFTAKSIYDCLVSVPFNQTNALQFLQYWEDTLQFQSTLAYLKNPPPDYQQPKFDLIAALDVIRDDVNEGKFANEYDFEYALQQVVIATHDAHVNLAFGILSLFVFGAPYGLVSASTNGLELPKAYIPDDLIEADNASVTWVPSAVITINGLDTTTFLETFASTQVSGYIEPDADWNSLMSNPAGDIQSVFSTFELGALFYPGENITYGFENGTTTDDADGSKLPWIAGYSYYIDPSNVPDITTGQQLFDWFILGIDTTPDGQSPAAGSGNSTIDDPSDSSAATSGAAASASATGAAASSAAAPASATEAAATSGTGAQPTSTDNASSTPSDEANVLAWDNSAYPLDPIISQPNLGGFNGGYVTGYILNDNVTGVLSIPNFDLSTANADTFSTAVRDFLTQTRQAGCTRVIIDLQCNTGGSELLAVDTFKQFFPTIDPFDGARQRAFQGNDALGNTFTTYFQTHQPSQMENVSYEDLVVSPWVAPVYIDTETNANFTSWGQFFGPHPLNGDQFTTVQRNNLSSTVFTEQTAGIVVYGFATEPANTTQPYPAKDVILLTDGLCSSACARFVEMMKHEGGARTVVAGGRPETGPMQAVSGNKGAELYSSFDLDDDFFTAGQLNSSVSPELPQNRDTDFFLSYASFNLMDGIRQGVDTPLQFVYEAADCRIFYTKHTVYNFVNLWNYVIDAFYRNPSLCIATSSTRPEKPSPTPSTIGDMIVAGLNPQSPPTPTRKRSIAHIDEKRSLDKRDSSSNNAPFSIKPRDTPDTLGLDADITTAGCQRCDQGFTCFRATVNRQGKTVTIAQCRSKCNLQANLGCPRGPSNLCYHTKGHASGVCISSQESKELKARKSPTGSPSSAATTRPNPQIELNFKVGGRLGSGVSPPGRG